MPVCRPRHSRSVSGVHQDVLSVSPRLSHYNSKISLERRLHDRNSSFTEQMVSGCKSSNSIGSSKDLIPTPTSELVKEIATLESEVINLERYLLSLYGNTKFVDERHCHRYEVNPDMAAELEEDGLAFVGKDETGKRMKIIELPTHPHFIGVQFHPEFKSRPEKPLLLS